MSFFILLGITLQYQHHMFKVHDIRSIVSFCSNTASNYRYQQNWHGNRKYRYFGIGIAHHYHWGGRAERVPASAGGGRFCGEYVYVVGGKGRESTRVSVAIWTYSFVYTGIFLTGFRIIVVQYPVVKRTTLLWSYFFGLVAHNELQLDRVVRDSCFLIAPKATHRRVRLSVWLHITKCAPLRMAEFTSNVWSSQVVVSWKTATPSPHATGSSALGTPPCFHTHPNRQDKSFILYKWNCWCTL